MMAADAATVVPPSPPRRDEQGHLVKEDRIAGRWRLIRLPRLFQDDCALLSTGKMKAPFSERRLKPSSHKVLFDPNFLLQLGQALASPAIAVIPPLQPFPPLFFCTARMTRGVR